MSNFMKNLLFFKNKYILRTKRSDYQEIKIYMMKLIRKLQKISLVSLLFCLTFYVAQGQDIRPIDGYGANKLHKEWGAKGTIQLNVTPISFADGIAAPAGPERPNPRMISNMVFAQEGNLPDHMGLSDFAWVWGQFIDHDITLSPEDEEQPMSIPIPAGDPYFDPYNTGEVSMHTVRSVYDHSTGTSVDNPRRFPNEITAFLDGSAVYGSDSFRANRLRSFRHGKMRISEGNMLPYNTLNGELDSEVDPDAIMMAMVNPYMDKWYLAGDVRANENPLLSAMHTLFVREHNRIAEELKSDNPYWSDEQIYQKARKIVGGIIQAIVYEEWLPTMGVQIPPYTGYDENINPGIMNIFATAAYRYGHTVINSEFIRMANDGHIMPQGNIHLKDAFFNPPMLEEGGGLAPYFKGMATQVEQSFDAKMIDDLRNFLFGPPGAGGLDLAALNINRGRERGLSDYNTARASFGLKRKKSFEQITSNLELSATLEELYGDINDIDPWVGFLSEDHMPNTLFGETVMKILEVQFTNIRDGDRFYYENDSGLSSAEIDEIKATRLSDVIKRNTNIENIQYNVFIAEDHHSTTPTQELANQELGIDAFPNPSTGAFQLSMQSPVSGEGQILTYNAYGQMVAQKIVRVNEGHNRWEMILDEQLPTGVYQTKVVLEGAVAHTTVIKTR